jgi:hypothetical protein
VLLVLWLRLLSGSALQRAAPRFQPGGRARFNACRTLSQGPAPRGKARLRLNGFAAVERSPKGLRPGEKHGCAEATGRVA